MNLLLEQEGVYIGCEALYVGFRYDRDSELRWENKLMLRSGAPLTA